MKNKKFLTFEKALENAFDNDLNSFKFKGVTYDLEDIDDLANYKNLEVYQLGGNSKSLWNAQTGGETNYAQTGERTFLKTASQFIPGYETYLDLKDIGQGAYTGNKKQLNQGTIGLVQPFSGKAITNTLGYLSEKFVNKDFADKNEQKMDDVVNGVQGMNGEAFTKKLFTKYGYGGYDKWIKDGKPKLQTGGINIDPAKRGTFKAQATRMGMSVQEAANKILNAPEGRYTPEMRRKANFARNFAKQIGGDVEYAQDGKSQEYWNNFDPSNYDSGRFTKSHLIVNPRIQTIPINPKMEANAFFDWNNPDVLTKDIDMNNPDVLTHENTHRQDYLMAPGDREINYQMIQRRMNTPPYNQRIYDTIGNPTELNAYFSSENDVERENMLNNFMTPERRDSYLQNKYPQIKQRGGNTLYVNSKNDPRYKAYQDSLDLYNSVKGAAAFLEKSNKDEWLDYFDKWRNSNNITKFYSSANNLTKLNKKEPVPTKLVSKFNNFARAAEFKKPTQPVKVLQRNKINNLNQIESIPYNQQEVEYNYPDINYQAPESTEFYNPERVIGSEYIRNSDGSMGRFQKKKSEYYDKQLQEMNKQIGGKVDAKDAMGRTYSKNEDGSYINNQTKKITYYDEKSKKFYPKILPTNNFPTDVNTLLERNTRNPKFKTDNVSSFILSKTDGKYRAFDPDMNLQYETNALRGADLGDDMNTRKFKTDAKGNLSNKLGKATTPAGTYKIKDIYDNTLDPNYKGIMYSIRNVDENMNRSLDEANSSMAVHPFYVPEEKTREKIANLKSPKKLGSMGCINCSKKVIESYLPSMRDTVYVTKEPSNRKQVGGRLQVFPTMYGRIPVALADTPQGVKRIEVLDGRTISMDDMFNKKDSVQIKDNKAVTIKKNLLKKYVR